MTQIKIDDISTIRAQAKMHHAFLLGLQLMISTNKDNDVVHQWMFKLFRRQHLDKFLSSFDKLGLSDLPDAVACAKYHVLSNSLGGVGVEYMYETDQKAWVRFRYPRWMYHGPTICGVPIGVSRGFLEGWYAYNGVSLKNPRLGYVCVSEDMTGEFGLCGYFKEYDHDLKDQERLQFAKGEIPPPFVLEDQPHVPEENWDAIRLEKANRNYAMNYIRNGITELIHVIGEEDTRILAKRAAKLIGLQYYPETAKEVSSIDGDLTRAADYLCDMFRGMGDQSSQSRNGDTIEIQHDGLRIIRDLNEPEAAILFECWSEIWVGTMSSQRQMKELKVERNGTSARWILRNKH